MIRRYHYVYRITNLVENKHYYGSRTTPKKTEILPKNDLGILYFSSKVDKLFVKDQKENPKHYKYKVIKMFKTRKEAIELEIKLHNKFNVGVNESFYNSSKQTSTKFDTTGIEPWQKKGSYNKHNRESIRKGTEKMLNTRKQNDSYRLGKIKEIETKKQVGEQGLTVFQVAAENTSKTMNSQEWKETIGKERIEKEKITKSKIGEDGLTIDQRGTKKRIERYLKKCKRYDLYKGDNIIEENLTSKQLKEKHNGLLKTTQGNPLGSSSMSLAKLKQFNKEYMIGYYILKKEINE